MEAIEKFVKLGSGDGSCYGSGDGSCYGYGSGDGSCYGYGYGSGDGYGLLQFKGHKIYNIDSINTCIESIKGDIAKGFILNKDFTIKKCYIVKNDTYFAHGDTLKDAINVLQNKIFADLDIESKITEFKNKFMGCNKYPAKDFYDWHYLLTGSCETGRKSFIFNNSIDLEKDEFTVLEFIELTKNAYGSEIIKKLM